MTEIKYVLEEGEPIPADVISVSDKQNDTWVLGPTGCWHLHSLELDPEPGGADWLSNSWGPLTVTAVREPKPERILIGPPHAHLDAPCTDRCYEPERKVERAGWPEDEVVHYRIPGDASPLTLCGLDVWEDSTSVTERAGSSNCTACRAAADEGKPKSRTVRVTMALDIEERDGKAVISTYEGEIGSCDSAVFLATVAKEFGVTITPTSGPSVLSLPQAPPGAEALVGHRANGDEIRFSRRMVTGSAVWFDDDGNHVPASLATVLEKFGPVTVVMREPRTWPKLDGAPEDLKAVKGASGIVYPRDPSGLDIFGPFRLPLAALQRTDGPLTEVFEDEPGGEPR